MNNFLWLAIIYFYHLRGIWWGISDLKMAETIEKIRSDRAVNYSCDYCNCIRIDKECINVKKFLAKYNIPVLNLINYSKPPYSPELAPCNFYLFPKVKTTLNGTRYQTIEALKKNSAFVIKYSSQTVLWLSVT